MKFSWKNLRIGDFEKRCFFESAILIFFFLKKKFFFAFFPWKQVKVYWLARMGQNFDQGKRDSTFWPRPNILKGSVFFNPRLCKSWDCPISENCIMWGLGLDCHLNYPARRYIVMQKSTYWLLVALWLQFALFGSCAPNVSKLFKSRVPWETFWSTVESRRAHSQHFFFQIDLSFCQVTIMNKLVVLATVCLIGAHGKLLS